MGVNPGDYLKLNKSWYIYLSELNLTHSCLRNNNCVCIYFNGCTTHADSNEIQQKQIKVCLKE